MGLGPLSCFLPSCVLAGSWTQNGVGRGVGCWSPEWYVCMLIIIPDSQSSLQVRYVGARVLSTWMVTWWVPLAACHWKLESEAELGPKPLLSSVSQEV